MAVLRIKRSREWNNRSKNICIYINGEKYGEIGSGETKDFLVPDGKHVLKAKIDWCGSREVEFRAFGSAIKTIKLDGIRFGNYAWVAFTVVTILRFVFKINVNIELLLSLSFFFIAAMMYYVTIGRNDYLRLKEA